MAFEEASSAVGSDKSQPKSPALGKRSRIVQPLVDDVLKQQMHQILLELLRILLCSRDFGCPGVRKLSNGKPSLLAKQDRHGESAPPLHGSHDFAPKGWRSIGSARGGLHPASGQDESIRNAAVRRFAQRSPPTGRSAN